MAIKKSLIIGIGDLHFPFMATNVFNWILRSIILPNKNDIYAIVQLGDLYDLFSYSKFSKRLFMTPREETFEAIAGAEKFWKSIHKVCPNAKKFQILGNHDARLAKRVVEKMPELDHLVKYNEIFTFDNVETVYDPLESLVLRNWHFIHGFGKEGSHVEAVHFNNVCLGHTHRGGTWTKRLNQRKNPVLLTELNCGFLGNPFHEALIYRPLKKYFTWTWGVGVIDQYGGRFIPYGGKIR